MALPGIRTQDPVFELKGIFGRIDLSAWIAGLSFAAGLYIADLAHVATTLNQNSRTAVAMISAIAIFFGSILLIQRHMQFSIRATSYGQPQRLVTTGIFKYSRNPIYVAFLIPLMAIAAIAPFASAAAIILYVGTMNATIIRSEELELERKFGDDYARYLASVPRWFLFF
jgi:protein-S-isoprenylcysteine O-methyltransferase Ste14